MNGFDFSEDAGRTATGGSLHPVVSRRARKNKIVLCLIVVLLAVITVMEGWKMLLVTLALGCVVVGMYIGIGWYLSDD